MHTWRMVLVLAIASAALPLAASTARAQQAEGGEERAVPHARGQNVAPVFEGWYRDENGLLSLSFGYLNRNFEEELSVPIGPDNRIEPGPADQGQPTYFVRRRQWGVFSVVVPKDLEERLRAEKKSVTWTLRAHGRTESVSANLGPAYAIDALKEPTVDNQPPVVTFDPTSAGGAGPRGVRTTITATAGAPTTVNFSVADDRRTLPQRRYNGVTLSWIKYRGAGRVQIASSAERIDGTGTASVTATFSEPGEYALRLEASDTSVHDFHCCWSNAYIYATVHPATGGR